MKKKLPSWISL